MVVDNHNIGIRCTLPHSCNKTWIKIRTFLTETYFGSCVDVSPETQILRQPGQFCTISRLRLRYPLTNLVKVITFVQALQNRCTFRILDPMKTGVIASSLHVSSRKFLRQYTLQKGNVLFHQLFLQVLGSCRDYDASASSQ